MDNNNMKNNAILNTVENIILILYIIYMLLGDNNKIKIIMFMVGVVIVAAKKIYDYKKDKDKNMANVIIEMVAFGISFIVFHVNARMMNVDNSLLVSVIVILIVAGVLIYIHYNVYRLGIKNILLCLLLIGMVSIDLICLSNAVFDNNKDVSTMECVISYKKKYSQKGTSYALAVTSNGKRLYLACNGDTYNSVEELDVISVYVHEGAFGMTWYEIEQIDE